MRTIHRSNPATSSTAAAALSALLVFLVAPALAEAQIKKPAPAQAAAPRSLADTLSGTARAEYDAAIILYQDGDFTNALAKFQRTHELWPDPRLIWNEAACEKNLRHYGRAIAAIEEYLAEAGALINTQRRADAEELLKTLRTLVGSLAVSVEEPGADIFVDDEKIGTSPLAAPMLVNAGNRRIRIAKPGFKDFVKLTPVDGAGEAAVTATLEREVHEGRLVVETGPNDTILLDGKPLATAHWDGPLASGGHLLKVSAPGMVVYQSEVVVQDGQTRRVHITLTATTSFPTKWLLAGGGVLAAAGVVITTVLLTRPSRPEAQSGPIAPGVLQLSYSGVRFGGVR